MTLPTSAGRMQAVGIAVTVGLAVLGLSMWLPWYFPSSSMVYKFGVDRTLLLLGKMAGMATLVLVVVQIVFMTRPRFLERAVGLDRLVAVHRTNGLVVLCLAVLHPLLVFAPEDIAAIPVKVEYWPEMLGAVLLVSLAMFAAVARFRAYARIPYHLWKAAHAFGAVCLTAGAFIHVSFVTDGYRRGLPLWFVVVIGVLAAVAWLWVVLAPLWRGRNHVVESVDRLGPSMVQVALRPQGERVDHAPGQFAILRPRSTVLPAEPHPFTIASGSEVQNLEFIIRCCGDWTSRVASLSTGDSVRVDGPYGLFSPEAHAVDAPLVLIAGGVGATPMLSMLRSMLPEGRKVHFIWANRTRQDIVLSDELATLERQHADLRVTHVLSRERTVESPHQAGRIDKPMLQRLLGGDSSENALYFVCGPQSMMRSVTRDLRSLGVPKGRIKTEVFGF